MNTPAFHRGYPGKLLGGVCAAIADRLGIDPLLVRIGFILTCMLSGGLAVSLYFVVWVLTPPSLEGLSPAHRFMDWVSELFAPPKTPAS
jgi:phage shock protein PspC (stress-responsive transcriptional regulator)